MIRVANQLRLEHVPASQFSSDETTPAALLEHGADHWIRVLDANDTCVATAALWWRHVPCVPGHQAGVIGQYSDVGHSAARAVLTAACEMLRAKGCTLAIGPMDGCTWRDYRFVTSAGSQPAFVLEPQNPKSWPRHWRENGFLPAQQYISTRSSTSPECAQQVERARHRLTGHGVRIRPLDNARGESELDDIHELTCTAFAQNALYTPLPRAAFMNKYRALLNVVPANMSFVAETDAGLAGYIFALPDRPLGANTATDTIVIKTCAIRPGRRLAGLGRLLVATCNENARASGYRTAIHALMHTRNSSANCAKSAEVIRRYSLFARSLV